MVSRKFRLPSSIILHNTRVIREDLFTVKIQKNGLSYNRYGFVVAKSIDKRANVRNRLKRTFRSIIEEKWLNHAGHDMLFILRPSIRDVAREGLQAKIQKAMEGLV